MALDGILLAETLDRASESVEQDQTAHMILLPHKPLFCQLILILLKSTTEVLGNSSPTPQNFFFSGRTGN